VVLWWEELDSVGWGPGDLWESGRELVPDCWPPGLGWTQDPET
jgi:hypothetical protein